MKLFIFIVLVPNQTKKNGVVTLVDFRLVNLTNMCYKGIAKLLVNKLKH